MPCPTSRFPRSKSHQGGLWSSCAGNPLAKGTHWPRCAERRSCWARRRLPLRANWQTWRDTNMTFPSSWQRPGKGREQTLSRCIYIPSTQYGRVSRRKKLCHNVKIIFLTPKASKALVSLGLLLVPLSTLLCEVQSKPPSPELSSR